jgi:N,N'-diacetyllegionaminate synthase
LITTISDPGSTHNGKLSYAKELIKISASCGCNAIKFQLFPSSLNCPPNIPLPYKWFPELVQYGKDLHIEVFASAFDEMAIQLIKKHCKSIKFSYLMKDLHKTIKYNDFDKIYVSCDIMSINDIRTSTIIKKLYCIPAYPVQYIMDFEGLFPLFDGISDHTYGINQTFNAVRCGAKIVEKHITLDKNDIMCPDGRFALSPKNLEKMVIGIRGIECAY